MPRFRLRAALLATLLLLTLPLTAAAREEAPSYTVDSLEAFKSLFLGLTEHLTPEFCIECSEDLYAQLTENDFELLYHIEDASGIARRNMTYWTDNYRLLYSEITYYPGYRVLNRWRMNDFSDMTDIDWALYNAAQEIVGRAQAETSDTLSLEKYLHDEIARRTVYYTNGNSELERKDTAVGVLLDGSADCDGYADAFYLLGNLAGFTVRLVHGTTDTATEENPYHMWNEIYLNTQWYAVDVTWDDHDNEEFSPYYIYLNVGSDKLRYTHTWDSASLLDPIAEETGTAWYYNAMGGVCDSWDHAAGYIAWRLNQGIVADSITLPDMTYDNDALNDAIQSRISDCTWESWFKSVGDDLYICYDLCNK